MQKEVIRGDFCRRSAKKIAAEGEIKVFSTYYLLSICFKERNFKKKKCSMYIQNLTRYIKQIFLKFSFLYFRALYRFVHELKKRKNETHKILIDKSGQIVLHYLLCGRRRLLSPLPYSQGKVTKNIYLEGLILKLI